MCIEAELLASQSAAPAETKVESDVPTLDRYSWELRFNGSFFQLMRHGVMLVFHFGLSSSNDLLDISFSPLKAIKRWGLVGFVRQFLFLFWCALRLLLSDGLAALGSGATIPWVILGRWSLRAPISSTYIAEAVLTAKVNALPIPRHSFGWPWLRWYRRAGKSTHLNGIEIHPKAATQWEAQVHPIPSSPDRLIQVQLKLSNHICMLVEQDISIVWWILDDTIGFVLSD